MHLRLSKDRTHKRLHIASRCPELTARVHSARLRRAHRRETKRLGASTTRAAKLRTTVPSTAPEDNLIT